jgi:hypothetical protein
VFASQSTIFSNCTVLLSHPIFKEEQNKRDVMRLCRCHDVIYSRGQNEWRRGTDESGDAVGNPVLMVPVHPLTRRVGCAVAAADGYGPTQGWACGEGVLLPWSRECCAVGGVGVGGRRLAKPGKPYNCERVGWGGRRPARASWWGGCTIYELHSTAGWVFRVDGTTHTPLPFKRGMWKACVEGWVEW